MARDLDGRMMQLQYLEMLRALGTAAGTKIIPPLEFMNLVAGIGEALRAGVSSGREGVSPGA